jgi:predicted metal-dependent HD superfamily phosphohydrolase
VSGDERELHTAWQRHVGSSPAAERWFDDLAARHRGADRHYHDLRHVRWVVHHARRLAAEAASPPLDGSTVDIVVAAAFFHDAVYDATRHDNEVVSADLARRALTEIGWSPGPIDEVAALIEATAHLAGDHPVASMAIDVLVAADLGVLAAEPARYSDYVRAVRREYAGLDDTTWRHGRAAFASTMLGRDHIFPPALGLESWERRARANLTAELAGLRDE